jgi:hypothetical protein
VSIYVNKDNSFHQAETVSRECPHCGAHAQLLPVATPSFEALTSYRPRHVGMGFRCAACGEPRFVRATVRAFESDRVELSSNLIEIERARERFPYSYLPAAVETVFREALDCYTAGTYNAFASMCRRTVDVSLAEIGGEAKLRWHELFKDVVEIGGVDQPMAQSLEAILFGGASPMPEIGAEQAAVLIEVIKDIVYQSYVRTAKLRAAMKMRRYFAEENEPKITPIEGRNRRESA